MKRESYQQFAIVASDSAQSLTEQLNEKLKELRGKNPVVTFEGMIARISYTETGEDTPEDYWDAYNMLSAGFFCKNCPLFDKPKKADGTVDKRTKVGYCCCPGSPRTTTVEDRMACEQLYELIKEGKVRLCLED